MNITKSLLTTSIAATAFTALLAAPAVARPACTDGGCAEHVAVAAATGTSPYAQPLAALGGLTLAQYLVEHQARVLGQPRV